MWQNIFGMVSKWQNGPTLFTLPDQSIVHKQNGVRFSQSVNSLQSKNRISTTKTTFEKQKGIIFVGPSVWHGWYSTVSETICPKIIEMYDQFFNNALCLNSRPEVQCDETSSQCSGKAKRQKHNSLSFSSSLSQFWLSPFNVLLLKDLLLLLWSLTRGKKLCSNPPLCSIEQW